MKCSECDNNLELVDFKDKDTGMWANEWRCSEHGAVDPFMGDMMRDIDRLHSDLMTEHDWKFWYINEDNPAPYKVYPVFDLGLPMGKKITSNIIPDDMKKKYPLGEDSIYKEYDAKYIGDNKDE